MIVNIFYNVLVYRVLSLGNICFDETYLFLLQSLPSEWVHPTPIWLIPSLPAHNPTGDTIMEASQCPQKAAAGGGANHVPDPKIKTDCTTNLKKISYVFTSPLSCPRMRHTLIHFLRTFLPRFTGIFHHCWSFIIVILQHYSKVLEGTDICQ